MPLPQVNERIKEVPAQALRAVFAGIGQVLLVADKIRNRAVEQVSGTTAVTAPPREAPATEPAAEPAAGAGEPPERAGRAGPAEPAGPAGKAEPAAEGSRWRSLDETGNVRLISEGDGAAAAPVSAPAPPDSAAPAAPVTDEAPADKAPADEVPADEAPAPPQASAAPDAAAADVAEQGGLPLSNYDELTIASLRARLRVLSVSQITTLLEYERAAQARPAVITMFERRLAKLAQDAG
jgi:hypothetical protein